MQSDLHEADWPVIDLSPDQWSVGVFLYQPLSECWVIFSLKFKNTIFGGVCFYITGFLRVNPKHMLLEIDFLGVWGNCSASKSCVLQVLLGHISFFVIYLQIHSGLCLLSHVLMEVLLYFPEKHSMNQPIHTHVYAYSKPLPLFKTQQSNGVCKTSVLKPKALKPTDAFSLSLPVITLSFLW